MQIIVVGVSYQQTPIHIREKLAFSKKKMEAAYHALSDRLPEVVILSTCNRCEIYAVAESGGSETLKDFFSSFHGVDRTLLEQFIYEKEDRQCVEHLFQVTAGLDSQVLGEDQILGQVKDAHAAALAYKGSGKVLNRLFQESITVGKRIRETTRISQNPTSISYIAVQYLARIRHDFSDKRLLMIGAGKMNRLALTYLRELGFARIFVANRTEEVAETLRDICSNIEVISFRDLADYIPKADVVLSCTAAPHLVITRERAAGYIKGAVFIDMAVPRDIDPELAQCDDLTLIDLDMLEQVAMENGERRQRAAEEAGAFVLQGVEEFFAWFNCLAIFPVIQQIEAYHEQVLDREIPKLVGRLKNTEDEQKITALLKGLIRKVYAAPVIRLKEMTAQNNPQELAGLLTALYREE